MAGFPHIAVVDDEEAIVDILSYSLKKKFPDASIIGFSRANEAWDWLGANQVDVLLTDLNMPDINGKEIVSMMEKTAPDTPVIVISGAVTLPELQEMESEFKNVTVFAKPLLTRELIAGIEEQISKSYAASEDRLKSLNLLHLLQVLHLQHKSVQVNVQHASGAGGVVLKNGEPVFIEFDGDSSERAFFKMLALDSPEILVEATHYAEASQMEKSFSQLISEHSKLREKA